MWWSLFSVNVGTLRSLAKTDDCVDLPPVWSRGSPLEILWVLGRDWQKRRESKHLYKYLLIHNRLIVYFVHSRPYCGGPWENDAQHLFFLPLECVVRTSLEEKAECDDVHDCVAAGDDFGRLIPLCPVTFLPEMPDESRDFLLSKYLILSACFLQKAVNKGDGIPRAEVQQSVRTVPEKKGIVPADSHCCGFTVSANTQRLSCCWCQSGTIT